MTMQSITQKEVKHLFSYNPKNGDVIREVTTSWAAVKGSPVDNIRKDKRTSYYRVKINQKNYKLHRIIWLYCYGVFPDNEIDHINGNGLDNRLCNLRAVTNAENSKNLRVFNTNTSGVTGVVWHKHYKKWQAQIGLNGKCIFLGRYKDIKDAISAREEAEHKYSFHALHGTLKC